MKTTKGYSLGQIWLHWLVAVLIALQFLLKNSISQSWEAFLAGRDVEFQPLVAAHIFGGLTILAFVVWRLVLRAKRGGPPPPDAEPAGLRLAAKAAHVSLYALMVAMPVSGAVAWFGSVEQAATAHKLLKIALLALIVLHVIAALVHQFFFKTNLIARMVKPEV